MNVKTTVLVVENDQELRESVVKRLRRAGLTVNGVGSAAECYQTLTSNTWRVAVVDTCLPDQSGYLLVEYIRANTAMKVIILTARDAADDRVKGYDSGADIYLVKPIEYHDLTTAIISLAQHRYQKQVRPMLRGSNLKSGRLPKTPLSIDDV